MAGIKTSSDCAQLQPSAVDLRGGVAGQAERASAYGWYVLAVLVAVYTFHWIDRYLFVITMESIKRDLAISDTGLGLLSGFAFSLVYSLCGLVIARWSDWGNRRSIIAAGLAFWSAMTAVGGMAQNFTHLFLARFGVGLGESACSPPAHSLISDYFPPRQRATAIAIYGLGLYLGLTMGLVVGGWITQYHGWRMAFAAAGLPGIALAILLFTTVREPQRGHGSSVIEPSARSLGEVLRFMLRRRSFVAYAIGSGLFVFAGNSVDSWAAVFLMRVHGLDSAEVGAQIGFIGGGAGIVGTLFFAVLADRLSVRDVRWYLWISLLGGLLTIPTILLFLFAQGAMLMYIFYFLAIFFGAAYMAPTIALTQRLVPARMRASSSAIILFSYNIIGIAGGNLVTGVLSDLLTPHYHNEAVRYALAATVVTAILGAFLTLYGARRLHDDFKDI